jgi:hypothetical protein
MPLARSPKVSAYVIGMSGAVGLALEADTAVALGSGGDADWIARSTAAGVVRANRMEDSATLVDWLVNDSTADHVSIDTTVKVPNAAGSIRFEVLNADDSASGSICVPFGASLGEGDVLWYSYRIRCSLYFAYGSWYRSSDSGPKFSIMSRDANGAAPTGSVQGNTVVDQINYSGGIVTGYNYDPSIFSWDDFYTSSAGGDFKWQGEVDNSIDRLTWVTYPLTGNNPETGAAWTSYQQERRRYGGTYLGKTQSSFPFRIGFGDPLSGGFRPLPDEWITYTFRVAVGAWDTANSRITKWAAREGQRYYLLNDQQNITLGTGPDYNGLTILPYTSHRAPGGRTAGALSGISGVSVLNLAPGTHLGTASLEYTASTGAWRFATAHDNFGTARFFSAANGITIINIASSSDAISTTLSAGVTLPQGTISLASTSGLPTSGTIILGTANTASGGIGEQLVQYTGISGNNLTGCSGGSGSLSSGQPAGTATFIQLRLDNAGSLPGSGVTTATFSVSNGRPTGHMWTNDVIVSTQAINAPGGHAPYGVSALADLAASMSSGQWSDFTMGGLNFSLINVPGTAGLHTVVEYCAKGHWDSVHKKIQFWGQGHNSDTKLLTWDDNTNQWTAVSSQPFDGSGGSNIGHAYYHMALDPATGDIYLHPYFGTTVYKKPYGSAWTTIANCPNAANQITGGLEWLPGLNSGAGGLCYTDAVGVWTWNPGTNTWTTRTTSLAGTGPYHNWSAVANSNVYFGGGNGSTQFYRCNASGTVTEEATDTPFTGGIWAFENNSPVLPHPNGVGLLQFQNSAGGSVRYWNGTSWSTLGTQNIQHQRWFAVTVHEYGVLVFVSTDGASTVSAKVFKP